MPDPRILVMDLETAPNIGYTWGPKWETNIIEFVEPWYILCIGYRWLGEKETHVVGLDDFKSGPYKPNDDKLLVGTVRSLFDEADILVAHNGDRFDIPKAHARMIVHGMDPPKPSKTIDTLKLSRHEFSFTSNKLGDVGQVLGLGGKMETGGFDLWKRCMAGDPKGWKKMKSYCASDVDLTVKLYERLRPWAPRHPNLATIADRPNACPRCLSTEPPISQGLRHNAVTSSHEWKCKSCGGYFRTRESIKSKATYTV